MDLIINIFNNSYLLHNYTKTKIESVRYGETASNKFIVVTLVNDDYIKAEIYITFENIRKWLKIKAITTNVYKMYSGGYSDSFIHFSECFNRALLFSLVNISFAENQLKEVLSDEQ